MIIQKIRYSAYFNRKFLSLRAQQLISTFEIQIFSHKKELFFEYLFLSYHGYRNPERQTQAQIRLQLEMIFITYKNLLFSSSIGVCSDKIKSIFPLKLQFRVFVGLLFYFFAKVLRIFENRVIFANGALRAIMILFRQNKRL